MSKTTRIISRQVRLSVGLDQASAKLLSETALSVRLTYLVEMVASMAQQMVNLHWNPQDLATLYKGVDPKGKALPTFGASAAERLGWTVAPEGLFCNSRVKRMAGEAAMRTLLAGAARDQVIKALVATWWDENTAEVERKERVKQRWKLLPKGTSSVWVRNLTRRVATWTKEGKLPTGLCDLEPTGSVGMIAPMSPVDEQIAKDRSSGNGQWFITMQLPTTAHPTTKAEWSWVKVHGLVDPGLHPQAKPLLPTLRLDSSGFHIDASFEVPNGSLPKHCDANKALALDWGIRRLLTGTVGQCVVGTDGTGLVETSGQPLFFDASGLIALWQRLRKAGEFLNTKIAHQHKLLEGCPTDIRQHSQLVAQLHNLEQQANWVQAKRKHLSAELAHIAARWAVDQALANGCGIIAIEDLKSMEVPKWAKALRCKISQQLRGQLVAALNDAALAAGLQVVQVDARGTSALCARCGVARKFINSPSGGTGVAWVVCPECGWQGDRDHAGAEGVLARAFVKKGAAPLRVVGVAVSEDSTPEVVPAWAPSKSAKHPSKKYAKQQARIKAKQHNRALAATTPKSVIPHTVARLTKATTNNMSSTTTTTSTNTTNTSDQVACRPGSERYRSVRSVPQDQFQATTAPTIVVERVNVPRHKHKAVGVYDGTRYAYRTLLRASPVPGWVLLKPN